MNMNMNMNELSWCKAPAQLTPLFITAAAFVL